MSQFGPRILLIGGTYRALCVLERLLERGQRVVAFIGQEGGGERDFCPEILELCDRHQIAARSAKNVRQSRYVKPTVATPAEAATSRVLTASSPKRYIQPASRYASPAGCPPTESDHRHPRRALEYLSLTG